MAARRSHKVMVCLDDVTHAHLLAMAEAAGKKVSTLAADIIADVIRDDVKAHEGDAGETKPRGA